VRISLKSVSNSYADTFSNLAETPIPRGFPGSISNREERPAQPLKSTRIPDARTLS
jgi:hypothetical protein